LIISFADGVVGPLRFDAERLLGVAATNLGATGAEKHDDGGAMIKFNLRDEEKNRARFLGNEANERFVCEFNGLSRTVKKLRKVTPPRAVRSPHPPLHERRLDAAGGLRRTSATSRSSHEMALIWAAALMPATRGLRAGERLCLPLKSVAALTHPKAGLVEPGYFGQNEAKGPLSCHFNAPLRPLGRPKVCRCAMVRAVWDRYTLEEFKGWWRPASRWRSLRLAPRVKQDSKQVSRSKTQASPSASFRSLSGLIK
jgi:hypothetical protein